MLFITENLQTALSTYAAFGFNCFESYTDQLFHGEQTAAQYHHHYQSAGAVTTASYFPINKTSETK